MSSTPSPKRSISRPKKLIFGALTALFPFLCAEIVMRLTGAAQHREDEEIIEFDGQGRGFRFDGIVRDKDTFWRFKPGVRLPFYGDSLNSFGFRGPDHALTKPAGTRRLLLLGDSTCFGLGVAESATFAARIRRWLNSSNETSWEVLNLGVPAFSMFQITKLFERDGRRFAPDAVVLYAGALNDYAAAYGDDDPTKHRRLGAQGQTSILDHLHLVRWLRNSLQKSGTTRRELLAEQRSGINRAIKKPDGVRLGKTDFQDEIECLATLCRAIPAPLLVIIPAAPAAVRTRDPDSDAYSLILRESTERLGLPLVDARTHFIGPKELEAELFCDYIHPSEQGHGILAFLVSRELAKAGIPGLPPREMGSHDLRTIQLSEKLAEATIVDGDVTMPLALDSLKSGSRSLSLPSACEVEFAKILIPQSGALLLDALAKPPDVDARIQQRLAVKCQEDDGPWVTLLDREIPMVGSAENPSLRIDLLPYAGRLLRLRLVSRGNAESILVERAEIHPFR